MILPQFLSVKSFNIFWAAFHQSWFLKKKLLCFIVSYIPPKYRNYKHVSLHFPVKWENSAQKSFLLSTILHRRYFSRLYLEIHNQRWIQWKITWLKKAIHHYFLLLLLLLLLLLYLSSSSLLLLLLISLLLWWWWCIISSWGRREVFQPKIPYCTKMDACLMKNSGMTFTFIWNLESLCIHNLAYTISLVEHGQGLGHSTCLIWDFLNTYHMFFHEAIRACTAQAAN